MDTVSPIPYLPSLLPALSYTLTPPYSTYPPTSTSSS